MSLYGPYSTAPIARWLRNERQTVKLSRDAVEQYHSLSSIAGFCSNRVTVGSSVSVVVSIVRASRGFEVLHIHISRDGSLVFNLLK